MWAKNADPDIFQLKNIFESDMSAEEKAKARDRIIGKDPAKDKGFVSGGRGEFGSNFSIICQTHQTRKSRTQLDDIRVGYNNYGLYGE